MKRIIAYLLGVSPRPGPGRRHPFSLTVIGVSASDFSVGLIPTTLASCTLGRMTVGTVVNLETDILGKYVERLLGSRSSGMRLSIEELRGLGY